jgi:hypothetical protein
MAMVLLLVPWSGRLIGFARAKNIDSETARIHVKIAFWAAMTVMIVGQQHKYFLDEEMESVVTPNSLFSELSAKASALYSGVVWS